MKIGVLAVQGDFALHQAMLNSISVENGLVRSPDELLIYDALIIPGGESTTFFKQLQRTGLFEAIQEFSKTHCIFGTCAGLITVANKLEKQSQPTLKLIDITVRRNAYGRQIASFIDTVQISLQGQTYSVEAVFIRAPLITSVGADVNVLSRHNDEIIMAENERVLVATFHPELTDDMRIHRYFVTKSHSCLSEYRDLASLPLPV